MEDFHLLEKTDVLVVGQIVLVEGEVVDVRQVHDLGHDVVQRLFTSMHLRHFEHIQHITTNGKKFDFNFVHDDRGLDSERNQ
jgi:hypothetical protein